MISRETNYVMIRQYSLERAVNVSACVCWSKSRKHFVISLFSLSVIPVHPLSPLSMVANGAIFRWKCQHTFDFIIFGEMLCTFVYSVKMRKKQIINSANRWNRIKYFSFFVCARWKRSIDEKCILQFFCTRTHLTHLKWLEHYNSRFRFDYYYYFLLNRGKVIDDDDDEQRSTKWEKSYA